MPALTHLNTVSREAAALLAAVADPLRWRLLAVLADGVLREFSDLQMVAAVPPNLLSYHLGVLRRGGLVCSTRRGRSVQYAITAEALQRLQAALPPAGGIPVPGLPAARLPESALPAAPPPTAVPVPVA